MTIRIGIAGLAAFYSHYYAGRATERTNASVVGATALGLTDDQLAELGRPSIDACAAEHDCPVYETLDELLDDDAVDAVLLCSPTSRRADDAVAVLESGRPVLTGKPAADSAAGAARIAEAAHEADLVAATTSPHRYDGRIREAHRRVAAGGIGDVVRVRASVYHQRVGENGLAYHDNQAAGEAGTAYTMGYYTADVLQWFVGDAVPVRLTGELENANTPYMAHPDLGSATIRYDDGTIGTMTITMANDHGPGYGWEVEVIGTDGTIRTDHHGHEGTHWTGGDDRAVEAFGRTLDPVLDHQFDAFVEAVADDEGPDAVSPGPAVARESLALCDAWVEAARNGGPVELS